MAAKPASSQVAPEVVRVGGSVVTSASVFEIGGEGPAQVTVIFRTGVTDETLRQRGWTHLAEHLLLTGAPLDHSVNGSVGSHFTYFSFMGERDEVLDRLRALATALTTLPVRHLAAERRVLDAEAERRDGRSVEEHLLFTRFGLLGPGLLASGELGLADVTGAQLQRWVEARFTAGNCALVLHNVSSHDLPALLLPKAATSEVAAARALDREWPATITLEQAGPAWGGVVARSPASKLAADVLQDRALQMLRQDHGVAYSPYVGYQPLDDAIAHVALIVDASTARRMQAGRLLPRLIAELAATGPTAQELDRAIRRRLSEKSDAASVAYAAAHAKLWPAAVTERDVPDWGALCAEDVRTALAEAADTSLFAVPESVVGQIDARRLPPWSTRKLTGTTYRRRGRAAVTARDERLVVSDEGMMHQRGPADRDTLIWTDVVAAERFLDDARFVLGVDGAAISVLPSKWRGGKSIAEAVDRNVPASTVIRVPERGDPAAIPKHPPLSTGLRIGIAVVVPSAIGLFATMTAIGWVVAAVLVLLLVANIRHERYGG